jgi:hypothetical protein
MENLGMELRFVLRADLQVHQLRIILDGDNFDNQTVIVNTMKISESSFK